MGRTEVKICGVRDARGMCACVESGADWVGLNFVPTSSRRILLEAVPALLELVGEAGPGTVGVFQDQTPGEVIRIATELGLDAVQLHGAEPPEYCAALAGMEVWKALSGDQVTRATLEAFALWCDRILVDGRIPGSGQAWDVQSLAALLDPDGCVAGVPVIVAGGLSPENVQEALRQSGAAGADVASGVEVDGEMDPDRVRDFVRAVREVEREK